MRILIRKKVEGRVWVRHDLFSLIPRKCKCHDTGAFFIVWLEYITLWYKWNDKKGKYEKDGYFTINHKP